VSDRLPLEIPDVLRLHAAYLPDKAAIIDNWNAVSYRELMWGVDRFASHLSAAGISDGSIVGVALEPSPAHIAVMIALWELDAVVCPINTRLFPGEISEFASEVGLTHVIVDPEHAHLRNIAPTAVDLPALNVPFGLAIDGIPQLDGAIARRDRLSVGSIPAMGFPTGGTTGRPKTALWSADRLGAILSSICVHIAIGRGDRELYLSPFFHISLMTGLFAPLFVGATVRLVSASNVDDVMNAMFSDGITRMFAVPTVLERLMAESPTALDRFSDARRGIRSVVFGASGSSENFVRRLHNLFPEAGIYTGYGASEFGPATRAYPQELMSGNDVGVGRPVAGVEIRIIDESGRTTDGEGEVVVRAPWQMLGYLGRPESDVWAEGGGIRTGDVGELRDGYLHLHGRSKEMIKTGGEQVFPLDVERVVMRHPAVAAAAAYGVPDQRWGERVECAVVLAPGTMVNEEELRSYCRVSLGSFKVPKSFVFVPRLPLTSNLKVDRRALGRAAAHD
jgi:acyl-CoA synthetase (AMP-forming)/AMP-acid ligase II